MTKWKSWPKEEIGQLRLLNKGRTRLHDPIRFVKVEFDQILEVGQIAKLTKWGNLTKKVRPKWKLAKWSFDQIGVDQMELWPKVKFDQSGIWPNWTLTK